MYIKKYKKLQKCTKKKIVHTHTHTHTRAAGCVRFGGRAGVCVCTIFDFFVHFCTFLYFFIYFIVFVLYLIVFLSIFLLKNNLKK